MQQLLGVPV